MLLDDIRKWLNAQGVPYREIHHEPTRTSEDPARAASHCGWAGKLS
jgi:hypothetical protein